MTRLFFVLHDPPYGSERVYNGLRWAGGQARGGDEVRVFLFGDSVLAAVQGQRTPDGSYNTGKQIGSLVRRAAKVGVCGTCMDARGVTEEALLPGTHRSDLQELTEWTRWAEQVINI